MSALHYTIFRILLIAGCRLVRKSESPKVRKTESPKVRKTEDGKSGSPEDGKTESPESAKGEIGNSYSSKKTYRDKFAGESI